MTKPSANSQPRAASRDASLRNQLLKYRQRSQSQRPLFARAYDELVDRLEHIDRGEIGPKLSETMPPFSLPSEQGAIVSLTSLLRTGPAVISFNRGHWCPYCKLDLRALAAIHDDVRRLGASVVSIMPDSAAFTADYTRNNDLPFPVLSDIDLGYTLSLGLIFWVGAEVQRLYKDVGINLEKYHGNSAYFLPMAAKFIIDQDGIVRARRVNIEFRERMEPVEILATLERLTVQKPSTDRA